MTKQQLERAKNLEEIISEITDKNKVIEMSKAYVKERGKDSDYTSISVNSRSFQVISSDLHDFILIQHLKSEDRLKKIQEELDKL